MKVKVLKSNNELGEVNIDVNQELILTDVETSLVSRVKNQALKQGTKKTKGRSEVRGHSAKPFRQKGTGNARQGSTKGAHMVGGGISHGPRPDFTSLKLNKKHKALILKKMLSAAIKDECLMFVELKENNDGLKSSVEDLGKALVVYSDKNKETLTGVRNLSNVELKRFADLSIFGVLNFNKILIDSECAEELTKILTK